MVRSIMSDLLFAALRHSRDGSALNAGWVEFERAVTRTIDAGTHPIKTPIKQCVGYAFGDRGLAMLHRIGRALA
jgi:hypothetical protein